MHKDHAVCFIHDGVYFVAPRSLHITLSTFMVYLTFPKAEIRDVCCLKKDILIFPAGNIYLTAGSKSVIEDRSHDKGGKILIYFYFCYLRK